jgi:hypothetical protein
MIYEDPKMNKQGAARKRKQVTLMIPHKHETICRLKSGESQREVIASYNNGSSPIYELKKQKDQVQFFMELNRSMKCVFKWHCKSPKKHN